ncbi:hypothetical protein [Mesorhizobium sp. IMUNJ 23232]|uniref:hypothetical protein n=1 Tax=Mesorhizobium sp. IMUNJ 23232 TaxID=3376064 RepID=UPI00379ED55F
MATTLTTGNDGYVADGGEVVYALQGNDQINIIHVDDSGGGQLDFDYFSPGQAYGNQGDDFLRSFDFGDMLYGDSGNDTIYGGAGCDHLEGGSGHDTIWTGTSEWVVNVFDELSATLDGELVWAGTGDDKVYLQNADNGDIVHGEDGHDTLYLYNSDELISQFSLIAGGSNSGLVTSSFEVLHYYGGDIFEVIEGGNEQDWIYGKGGTDLISGWDGDDLLRGDEGADIINGGDGGDDILGGDEDDVLRGDAGNDLVRGGNGNDEITDGAGNDDVFGDAGNDTMRTGTGTDTVRGGAGNDVIREDGSDITYRSVGGTQIPIIGGDTLRGEDGNDNIQGGSGADIIEGGNDADTLRGGDHNDTISDGAGNDTVFGDAGNDTIHTGTGTDTVRGGEGNDIIREQGRDVATISGVEVIGGDVLHGESGNDDIQGGTGDDDLYGGAGDDILNGGAHGDLLDGGSETDTASYALASAGVTASLTNTAINTGYAVGDSYVSIENLTGSSFDDVLNADNLVNTVNGGIGNDNLKAYRGNDTLTGGAGADNFIFNSELDDATNVDTITDYSAFADTIQLDNAFFTGLAAGVLATSAFKDIAGGPKDADDRIIYNSGTGNLYYDADGSAAVFGNVKFAVLDGTPTLTAADFVVI